MVCCTIRIGMRLGGLHLSWTGGSVAHVGWGWNSPEWVGGVGGGGGMFRDGGHWGGSCTGGLGRCEWFGAGSGLACGSVACICRGGGGVWHMWGGGGIRLSGLDRLRGRGT